MDPFGLLLLMLLAIASLLGIVGAIALFLLIGAESGLLGLIAYAFSWAYLTTFMAAVSVIAGIVSIIWLKFKA